MKLLCIDIGGTYSRFGIFSIVGSVPVQIGQVFVVENIEAEIKSFTGLLEYFEDNKLENFTSICDYKLIVLSVAAPIFQGKCTMPSNGWVIDKRALKIANEVLLINDFVAQAMGLICRTTKPRLSLVHSLGENGHGWQYCSNRSWFWFRALLCYTF